MLQSVSWKDFLIVVGLGVGLYYGWWLIRYRPGLRWSRPGAAGLKDGAAAAVEISAPARVMMPEMEAAVALAAVVPVAAVEVAERALPVEVARPVFLPEVAARLAVDIAGLMAKARKADINDKELAGALRQLLGIAPYDKLKTTPFREKIEALIGREAEKYGSITFDPEAVRALWQE